MSRVKTCIGVRKAFLDWGVLYPTFQDEKVENLMSPAVNKGDLLRLNYNKTVFGRSSASDSAGRAHDALAVPRIRWGGVLPPHSHPLSHRDRGASFSFWIGTSTFRSKLCLWFCHKILTSMSWTVSVSFCVCVCVCYRMIEYVDNLHSHFVDPVLVKDGCYQVPQVTLRC